MAVNLLQDIDSQINQAKNNGFSTAGGSAAVNSIGNTYSANELDALNQLRSKYSSQLNSYNNQLAAVPAKYQSTIDGLNQDISGLDSKYQPDYDSHALQEQVNLRKAMEDAANYGQLGGGALPQWELQANATKQTSDNTTSSNKNNEYVNLKGQLDKTNAQKQSDIDTITNTINSLGDQGESDLQSLLGQYSKNYLTAVQQQQAAEASAAATVEAAKIKANSSGTGTDSTSNSNKYLDSNALSTYITKYQNLYNQQWNNKEVDAPTLMDQLDSESGLTDAQRDVIAQSITGKDGKSLYNTAWSQGNANNIGH